MAEELDTNLHTSSSYGSMAGMKLFLKLSACYATYIAILIVISVCVTGCRPSMYWGSPLIFALAFAMGAIPAVPIGSLAGTLLSIIFTQFGKRLTEWKVVGIGFFIGIICALLLEFFLFLILYRDVSDIPSILKAPDWVWTPPSIIALFAILWLARKLGKPFLIKTTIP